MKKEFEDLVYKSVARIPKGMVSTYKEVAVSIGSPKAFRAVGNILNKNKDFHNIPCHRVIRSDGFVGEYVFGNNKKINLLKKEGVGVENGKIDLDKFLFKGK